MHPSLIVGIAIAAAASGALAFAYVKGNQACVSEYEHKALQAKLNRAELQLSYYRNAKKSADELSEKAKIRAQQRDEKASNVQIEINKLPDTGPVCVPADFVRQIAELRSRPNTKKQNSRSTFQRLSKKNAITYKDLGPKDVQTLFLAYELNEQHNVSAVLTGRRYHKRIQKIYAGESLTGR